LVVTQLEVSRVLGLVSFDSTQGRLFFTSETHVVIARLCLLLPTPLALSPQKATPVSTTTLALSPQKVTRSIYVLSSVTGVNIFCLRYYIYYVYIML
jgi:hypothetical protein